MSQPVTDEASKEVKISNVPLLLTSFLASCTTGGSIYAFGIYGDAIKKSLLLSQLELDTISAAIFVAGLFAWIPGLVVDRCGTTFSLVLGGTCGAFFSIIYWAICRRIVPIPLNAAVTVLSANGVAICLSCALIVGSVFKIAVVCSGEGQRGQAVGIAKGFVGMGAGIYANLYQSLRTPSESALDFLPVSAVCFLVCVVLPAACLLPWEVSREQLRYDMTSVHFQTMYASLLVIAVVIVSASIMELVQGDTLVDVSNSRNYGRALLMLAIWLGPIWSLLLLPRKEQQVKGALPTIEAPDTSPDELTPLTASPKELRPQSTRGGRSLVPKDPNLNMTQMLQTPSAWLMLWTTAILVGSGTYKTNNMGEMVEALKLPETVVPSTLALFSVSQSFGRLLTGVLSENTLYWNIQGCGVPRGLPRPFYLVVASLIALISHLVLAFATTQWAFVASCVVSGLAFGAAWPLMVLIVGEVFGMEHHGANYMFFDGFTKALGTMFMSGYLAGSVYQAHIDGNNRLICVGVECFQATHLVVAGLALSGVLASFALQYTSRHAYSVKR